MKKNGTSIIVIPVVIALFGLVFLVCGLFLMISYIHFIRTANETTGVIVSITTYYDSDDDLRYRVYVRYSVDGREYDGEYGSYHTGMIEGQSVKIYYDPDNPRHIQSKGSFITGFVFVLFSVVFGSVGLIPLILTKKAKSKKKRLAEYGEKLTATIKEIADGNIYVNNIRCRNIICEYKDRTSGNTYLFKSENVYEDLNGLREGQTIPVYADYNDYSKYYVAVEEYLPGTM